MAEESRDFVDDPFRSGRDFDYIGVRTVRDKVELHFLRHAPETEKGEERVGGVALTIAGGSKLAGTLLEATFAAEEWLKRKTEEMEDSGDAETPDP